MVATRYQIIVEAAPGDVPGVVRLRACLKSMWRGYQLRAVEMRELSPDPELEAAENAETWRRPGDTTDFEDFEQGDNR